jgi:hypothetical protein
MSNTPNIFNYATSELTQDAFIAWLTSWANSDLKIENEQLYNLGTEFLKSILAKQNIKLTRITNLDIKTQFHKIDVFVSFKMNDKQYAIIIEDKVRTSDHSDQLKRYRKHVEHFTTSDVIIPIFFKTGYHVNRESIKNKGYYFYDIKDFISVLTPKVNEIDNAILSQYFAYLLNLEKDFDKAHNDTLLIENEPISQWEWWSWVKFFNDSNNNPQFNSGWGEVPNRREALLAFWYEGTHLNLKKEGKDIEYSLYLDIQFIKEIRVSYRLGLKGNQLNIDLRNNIYNQLKSHLITNGIEVKRPHFKKAKNTVLLAPITNLDTSLNQKEFLEKMIYYKEVLKEFKLK